jgi:general stress protein 26
MTEQNSYDCNTEKLQELIKDINIAMLTTVNSDGSLCSRPMATQKTEFNGEIWFFTSDRSGKVDEIAREQQVNVSYSNPDKHQYVSVSGRGELVCDRQKIEELWNPILNAWFPDGKEQADLALLKITVDKAEYWDSPSSAVVNLVGFVKAIATGKPYEGGEHEKLSLNS